MSFNNHTKYPKARPTACRICGGNFYRKPHTNQRFCGDECRSISEQIYREKLAAAYKAKKAEQEPKV